MPIPAIKATLTTILQAALEEHDSIHGADGHDYSPRHWSHFARKLLGAPPYKVFPNGTTKAA